MAVGRSATTDAVHDHVEAGLLDEHALDQLSPRTTVDLANLGRGTQHFQSLLELVDKEILGVAMIAPPFVLRFKPPLGLSEQDDLHDVPGTA